MKIKNLLLVILLGVMMQSCTFFVRAEPIARYPIVNKYVIYGGCTYYDYCYPYYYGARYYVVVCERGIEHTYMVSNYDTWYGYGHGSYYGY